MLIKSSRFQEVDCIFVSHAVSLRLALSKTRLIEMPQYVTWSLFIAHLLSVYRIWCTVPLLKKINVLVQRPRLSFETWRCRARQGVCREPWAEANGVFFVVVAGEVYRRNNRPWSVDSPWRSKEPRNRYRSEEPRSRAAKYDNTYFNQSHAIARKQNQVINSKDTWKTAQNL